MEYASVLAGERWSDHPPCTHPLLAQLARLVNDYTGDEARQDLAPMVPSVVGRLGDETTSLTLAVAIGSSIILDVPEATQRVLAAGLMRADEVCTDTGPALEPIARDARAALDLVPGAVSWVERLELHDRISLKMFSERCAPTMIRSAVEGLVTSGISDCERRLRGLLDLGIAITPAPAGVIRTEHPLTPTR
jgi:hypothetical protein